jgi:hypothetical protein
MELTYDEIQEIKEYQAAMPDKSVIGVKDSDGSFNVFVNVARQEVAEYVVKNQSKTFPEML